MCCKAVGCLRVSVKAWRCLHRQDLTDAHRRMLAERSTNKGFSLFLFHNTEQVSLRNYFPWCTSVFLAVHRQHYWLCTVKILAVHARHTSCAPPGSSLYIRVILPVDFCKISASLEAPQKAFPARKKHYPSMPTRGLWTASAQTTVRTKLHRSTFLR